MKRIYTSTTSADDWRKCLAQPERQWRAGYSARELAECWEQSDGFPPELKALFATSNVSALRELELLLAIPEYQVKLPCGSRPSQNDLFVLARALDGGLVAIMVEGKASEPFGETLETWLKGASTGKRQRLQYLCDVLGLMDQPPLHIRYQLFHRLASAVIEARRFNAHYAMMVVHSFSPEHLWFTDYQDYLSLFGVEGKLNELVELPALNGMQVFAGWAAGRNRLWYNNFYAGASQSPAG